MKESFWVRAASLLAVVCILSGYNAVLEDREREGTVARLTAQVGALSEYIQSGQGAMTSAGRTEDSQADDVGESVYADGVWEGGAQGFGGQIVLEVKVEKGRIGDISIISAEKEDPAYLYGKGYAPRYDRSAVCGSGYCHRGDFQFGRDQTGGGTGT